MLLTYICVRDFVWPKDKKNHNRLHTLFINSRTYFTYFTLNIQNVYPIKIAFTKLLKLKFIPLSLIKYLHILYHFIMYLDIVGLEYLGNIILDTFNQNHVKKIVNIAKLIY